MGDETISPMVSMFQEDPPTFGLTPRSSFAFLLQRPIHHDDTMVSHNPLAAVGMPNWASSAHLVSHHVAFQTPDQPEEELSLVLPIQSKRNTDLEGPLNGAQVEQVPKSDSIELLLNAADDFLPEPKADRVDGETDRFGLRLRMLQKPASSLTLIPAAIPAATSREGNVVPENQAAAFLASQPTRFIGGQMQTIPRAARVHVPFCHRPTYFQELNLEQCGNVDCESLPCLQNAFSSFWFLSNAVLLPYRIASQSPCRCVPAEGDCTTCQSYPSSVEPLQCGGRKGSRGVLTQAASMAGFAFLIL